MNEHVNTVRALEDKKLLVTSIWCYFGIHNYERWSDSFQPNKNRSIFMQSRKCCHCGIIRAKEVKLPEGIK